MISFLTKDFANHRTYKGFIYSKAFYYSVTINGEVTSTLPREINLFLLFPYTSLSKANVFRT